MKITPLKIKYITEYINKSVSDMQKCKTLCPFDRNNKLNCGSWQCLNQCKHLIKHDNKNKIVYCHKFYNKYKAEHYYINWESIL